MWNKLTVYHLGALKNALESIWYFWGCGFEELWFSGNLESGGKGEKTLEHSATIALQSPLPEYNGRFEFGSGPSMVYFSVK
jgi:hypothetical protein